jgi:hypothetical protein
MLMSPSRKKRQSMTSEKIPRLWQNSEMRRSWKTALVVVLALVVIAIIVAMTAAPSARRALIVSLGSKFKSDVQISSIHVIPGPTVYINVNGLVLTKRDSPGFPPLIKASRISVEISVANLFRRPVHISRVRITDLEIHVPPRKAPRGFAQASASGQPIPAGVPPPSAGAPRRKGAPIFTVDEIDAPGAFLVIMPRKAGKLPLEFPIEQLKMSGTGVDRPAHYHALLTNPKPVGQITADGDFGPWNGDEPALTPVTGVYSFNDVDMGTIHGLGGTLSSRGQFDGELDSIHTAGHTEIPDFQLGIAGHPMPLQTDFDALVDGSTGNVYLNSVKATLGASAFDVSGKIVGTPGVPGRTINITAVARGARLQDFLRLAVPQDHPLMTGVIGLHTDIRIPPGPEDMSHKLFLDGAFDVGGAHFTEKKIQSKVDTLSRKGSGHPKDLNMGNVLSNLRGRFYLENGVMYFSNLTFSVPSADVSLSGTYTLQSGLVDFRGHLRLQAKLSQTMTGFKSIMLKPFDRFFSKNGAGTEVPIKITGTSNHVSFGTDFHDSANK